MAALLGLIITTSYIIKPVRNALFLSQYGADFLPYVYILVALVVGFVASGFARLVSRFYIKRVFFGSAIFFALSLLVFWRIVQGEQGGFVFYLWVSIFTIVMPTLFWLYANYIFYSNEAKRAFGILAAGGILGSIAGGALTSVLVRSTGTAGLLLYATTVLVAIAALIVWIEVQEKDRIAERRSDLRRREKRQLAGESQTTLGLVKRSRYLTSILFLVVLTTVISTLVDYQFNTVAEENYQGIDTLTSFFGTFFAAINVLAFLLQLFLAGRILSHFGVGAGLLFLPLALASGSLAFLFIPGLWAAAFIKASDIGLSNSLNKSSTEILWLPIPLEIKNRAKAWLDMFVERVSRGVGGLLILVATSVLSLSLGHVSLVVLALLIPWIVLAIRLKREYVTAFRTSLARRDIDIAALTEEVQDQAGLSVLHQVLSGNDERETLYALELLQGTDDKALMEPVIQLASHQSAPIRAAALKLLRGYPNPPELDNLAALSRDPSADVSAEALGLLLRIDRPRAQDEITRIFRSGNVTRIHAMLNCMENSPDLLEGILDEDFVRRYDKAEGEKERELAARALGFLPATREVVEALSALLADASIPVARAAAASAGKLQQEELIPGLLAQLPRRSLRVAARGALSKLGPAVLNSVGQLMPDPDQDVTLRRALPQVLAEFEDQRIVTGILAHLPEEDLPLHYQAIKTLGKMRSRYPELRFPAREVDRLLDVERDLYCTTASRWMILRGGRPQNDWQSLLLRAIEERLSFTRERIFRLLGLIHPADDIFNTWHRIVRGRPSVRAAALEFLGNLLSAKHREYFLPLLEASSWEEVAVRAREQTPNLGALTTFRDAVVELIEGTDAWLAACAVTLAGEMRIAEALEPVRAATDHPDEVVREAAKAVLERWASRDDK
jgi:ATP/ADP translocase/HEAT repeat protein